MNATVYVFSKLNGKYSQYPDDYTRELFDKFQSLSGAGAKMVIHREGDLMYYGYIRQLTRKEDYMGFCILLNGMMLTQMEQLASLFEKAYKEANVFFTVEMAESVSAMIKEGVAKIECKALPPVVYGISRDMTKVFVDEDGNKEEIVRAVAMYPYVVLEYNEGRETCQRGDYVADERVTASDVQDKNVEAKQSEEPNSLLDIVILILLGCGIIFLYEMLRS